MKSQVFRLAWQFIKKNGYSLSEALRCAWANIKLRKQMAEKIVKFRFSKAYGTIREAYGTLMANMLPQSKGAGRKQNDAVQTYFDTEKGEYRCFKKANLIEIA